MGEVKINLTIIQIVPQLPADLGNLLMGALHQGQCRVQPFHSQDYI